MKAQAVVATALLVSVAVMTSPVFAQEKQKAAPKKGGQPAEAVVVVLAHLRGQ